jgi:hypothetical protein
LNSIIGQKIDKLKDTKIMNTEGWEDKSKFKKLFMSMNPIDEIEKMPAEIATKTKKYAMRMYWGNMILTAAVLGWGLPKVLNYVLKRDVESDLQQDTKLKN